MTWRINAIEWNGEITRDTRHEVIYESRMVLQMIPDMENGEAYMRQLNDITKLLVMRSTYETAEW